MKRPDAAQGATIGSRMRRYREEKGLSLSQLARDSGVSKSYLWRLENPPATGHPQRPSARTLYAIARALGVTMADILGEHLVLVDESAVDPALQAFADQEGIPEADVAMLASIQWRGDRPRTIDRWRHIYQAIVTSRLLDDNAPPSDT